MNIQAKLIIFLIGFGFFSYFLDIGTTVLGLSWGYQEINPDAVRLFTSIGQPLTYLLVLAQWIIVSGVVSVAYIWSSKTSIASLKNPITLKFLRWMLVMTVATWLVLAVPHLVVGSSNLWREILQGPAQKVLIP